MICRYPVRTDNKAMAGLSPLALLAFGTPPVATK